MTTDEILDTFSDINFAYNNASKYDTLKRMLDELQEQTRQSVLDKVLDEIEEDAFHDANGVIYCVFNHVRQIIKKYKEGDKNG